MQFLCQTSREDDRQQTQCRRLVTQVADADSPAQSARRWPQRIPAIPLALGLTGYLVPAKRPETWDL